MFGRGMISDDTEHTCLVSQALINSGGNVDVFRRSFARGLRWWLLGIPAGAGLATVKATVRLWLGWSPQTSGVFSAGNGPAMRAAVLGAAIEDEETLREFVRASTRVTHSDPKAEYGALAVAWAANWAAKQEPLELQYWCDRLHAFLQSGDEPSRIEFRSLLDRTVKSVQLGESTTAFAAQLGLQRGVTGYVYHTVPVALHACLSHPCDFRRAVISVIECGGDADTTAAIVGGIVGAVVGKEGIPREWLAGLSEWPRTIGWLEKLGTSVAESRVSARVVCPRVPILGVLLRNMLFLVVVLIHGVRRMLPPY